MSDPKPEQTIWQSQLEMYEGFLTGNRALTDSHIHPECTVWDSGHWGLMRGLDGLAEVRAQREPGTDELVESITPGEPVIDVVGDVAVVRHTATVRFRDGQPDEELRNTGVWRLEGDRWRLIHNHEQVA